MSIKKQEQLVQRFMMNAHSMSEFTGTDKTYLTMPYFQKSQNKTHGLIEAHIFNEHIFQN